MLIAAVLAGVALYLVAHRLSHGEDLQDEDDIKPERIVEWFSEGGDRPVSRHLVAELSRMARRRAENNAIRGSNYDALASRVRWALLFAGLELLTAVVVRL
jgi:hypothetical protein